MRTLCQVFLALLVVTMCGPHYALAQEAQVESTDIAMMRTLDRVSGRVEDLEMRVGQSYAIHGGHLSAVLLQCRYPADNPSGDAYAYVDVIDTVQGTSVFGGWMMASSPALNALEDARYDLWPLRCKTS